jgi:cation diffusion facilitator CzcD-associated flavoprotein CzcO
MDRHAGEGEPWAKAGRQPKIAIIGAGMSGIAAVIKLRRAGYNDLVVFEKADRVGGTWRENRYPGLSCDIPSRWYSFRFALNPDWTHRFSYGPEIQSYMEKVARDFDVESVVRFGTRVETLDYEAPNWRLVTGDDEELLYDIVIGATGILHKPVLPDIEGLESFEGACFHSARWDHSVELAGKRVGVIGTGSTAAQIIGDITDQVEKMVVFQRTPQWMVPLAQTEYSPLVKRIYRLFPFLQWLPYYLYFLVGLRTFGAATVGDKKMQARISKACLDNLEQNVADPELRARLTPDYQAACKRLILCSSFYPAISSENAALVTDPIVRATPTGVETDQGEFHELDVLVLATGFDPSAFILPTKVTGEKGRDLEKFWDRAPRALRAVAMPGFPNFWMLEGPTGPVGNLSLITISEHQIDFVIQMLDKMKREGHAAICAKTDSFMAYNEAMREALPNTVWMTGGCTSWYIDESGLPNLYPWAPERYLKDMRRPDYGEFHLLDEAAAIASA